MGRFITRDTWDGDANQPMSYNRWNYVNGNPANLTDPTGQFPCEICDLISVAWPLCRKYCCDQEKNIPSPTQPNDTYNGETITDWGCGLTDHDCREDRSDKVLKWLKNTSNGWWGKEFAKPRDLSAWILEHEAAQLRNKDTKEYEKNINPENLWYRGIRVEAGYISHLFEDGNITPLKLSTFTSFYNPKWDSVFDSRDWRILNTEPASWAYTDIDTFSPAGIYYDDGHAVTMWWDTKLDKDSGFCAGCTSVFEVFIPIEQKYVHFGYK